MEVINHNNLIFCHGEDLTISSHAEPKTTKFELPKTTKFELDLRDCISFYTGKAPPTENIAAITARHELVPWLKSLSNEKTRTKGLVHKEKGNTNDYSLHKSLLRTLKKAVHKSINRNPL